MTPVDFVTKVLDPGLLWCSGLPGWHIVSDDRARVGLTAISGQEANWTARVQGSNGPAHGLFQFEKGGGVAGVLHHSLTHVLAGHACAEAGISSDISSVWRALADPAHDNLAVAFARLLLFTDPAFFPATHDEEGWWKYYARNWRPGSPSRARWAVVFPQAWTAVHKTPVTGAVAATSKQNELKGQTE